MDFNVHNIGGVNHQILKVRKVIAHACAIAQGAGYEEMAQGRGSLPSPQRRR